MRKMALCVLVVSVTLLSGCISKAAYYDALDAADQAKMQIEALEKENFELQANLKKAKEDSEKLIPPGNAYLQGVVGPVHFYYPATWDVVIDADTASVTSAYSTGGVIGWDVVDNADGSQSLGDVANQYALVAPYAAQFLRYEYIDTTTMTAMGCPAMRHIFSCEANGITLQGAVCAVVTDDRLVYMQYFVPDTLTNELKADVDDQYAGVWYSMSLEEQ